MFFYKESKRLQRTQRSFYKERENIAFFWKECKERKLRKDIAFFWKECMPNPGFTPWCLKLNIFLQIWYWSQIVWPFFFNFIRNGHRVLFRSVRSILFRSFKGMFRSFPFFFELLVTYETQKNVLFFSKERKWTQRMQNSFAKNGKERKERKEHNILLQRM